MLAEEYHASRLLEKVKHMFCLFVFFVVMVYFVFI